MFFIYYEDNYPDNGGVGLEQLNTVDEATEWIEKRMAENPDATLANYTVIAGEKRTLSAVDRITKVKLE